MIKKQDIKYYIKHLGEKSDKILLFGTMNELREAFQLPRSLKNTMSLDSIVATMTLNGEVDYDFPITDGYVITHITYKGIGLYTAHRDGVVRFLLGL